MCSAVFCPSYINCHMIVRETDSINPVVPPTIKGDQIHSTNPINRNNRLRWTNWIFPVHTEHVTFFASLPFVCGFPFPQHVWRMLCSVCGSAFLTFHAVHCVQCVENVVLCVWVCLSYIPHSSLCAMCGECCAQHSPHIAHSELCGM